MMATVPHVTSGLGLRKFQADGFLLTRVYVPCLIIFVCPLSFDALLLVLTTGFISRFSVLNFRLLKLA